MNSIPVMNGDFPLVRLACRSFRVALDPLSAPVKKWMNTYITSRVSIWEIYSCVSVLLTLQLYATITRRHYTCTNEETGKQGNRASQ